MITKEFTLYDITELSTESQNRAFYTSLEIFDYPFFNDIHSSVTAFCDIFSIKIRDYEINEDWIRFEFDFTNDNFRGFNKKKILSIKDDLTGYYLDALMINKLKEEFVLTGDLKNSFFEAIEAAKNDIKYDLRHHYSFENLSELCHINEVFFLENGKLI